MTESCEGVLRDVGDEIIRQRKITQLRQTPERHLLQRVQLVVAKVPKKREENFNQVHHSVSSRKMKNTVFTN